MRDLYKGKDLGTFVGSFKGTVPCHGVLMLRLTPSKWVANVHCLNKLAADACCSCWLPDRRWLHMLQGVGC